MILTDESFRGERHPEHRQVILGPSKEVDTVRIVSLVFASIVVFAAVAAILAPGSKAQTPRYMAAPDAPGSVWRIDVQTGQLEHCSLVKGGCDIVDQNE